MSWCHQYLNFLCTFCLKTEVSNIWPVGQLKATVSMGGFSCGCSQVPGYWSPSNTVWKSLALWLAPMPPAKCLGESCCARAPAAPQEEGWLCHSLFPWTRTEWSVDPSHLWGQSQTSHLACGLILHHSFGLLCQTSLTSCLKITWKPFTNSFSLTISSGPWRSLDCFYLFLSDSMLSKL